MAFLLTAELAPALRADLAEYTLAAVEELLGPAAMGAVRRERRVPGLVKAREVSRSGGRKARLAVHVRLFLLGDEVEAELIDEALPSVSASAALRDELLKGGRARFQVVPTAIPSHLPIPALVGKDAGRQDVLIASDWGELAGVTPRPDHVMHVGGATRTLASLATYWPGSRVLDVGTGCGVHAIFAALSGARVTATDVSKKALSYAEFNAALAGVSLDLREGSLLEPADGRYDVVVSNPPFVITPQNVRLERYDYRDNGRVGDAMLAELVGGLDRVLALGGRAWILGNWEIRGEWSESPAAWLDQGKLDAWVIQRERLDPPEYIEMWLRDGGILARDVVYEPVYEAWLADFARRGVTGVGLGYMCVGNDDGLPRGPWRRFEEVTGPAPANLNAFAELVWANRELMMCSDAELARKHLVARGIEHRLHTPGKDSPFMLKLAQTGGFASELQVTSAVAVVVGACDGELSVGILIDTVADLLEQDPSSVRDEVFPALRELIGLGVLRRA